MLSIMKHNIEIYNAGVSFTGRNRLFYLKYVSLLLCVAILCLTGCKKDEISVEPAPTVTAFVSSEFQDGQRLLLKVTPGNQYGGYDITTHSSGSNPHVSAVSEVLVFLDGQYIDLGQAVERQMITVEELDAYAKLDSKAGICRMEYASLNGLSLYVYHYDGFDIASYYDVFESPDGSKEHHQKFIISASNQFTDICDTSIDYPHPVSEDWGVSVDVLEAAQDHLTLKITQSGGQHFGILSIGAGFELFKNNESSRKELYFSTLGLYIMKDNSLITNNGTTELVIPWPETCGALSSGEYTFRFRLEDNFDSSQIHPFTRDYTDHQYYEIKFIIP